MPDPDRLGRHDSWEGVRAAVAGFGVSGFAAADNLNHLGASVIAMDESDSGDKAEKGELLEVLGADIRLGRGLDPRPSRRHRHARHLAGLEAGLAAARPGPGARRTHLG